MMTATLKHYQKEIDYYRSITGKPEARIIAQVICAGTHFIVEPLETMFNLPTMVFSIMHQKEIMINFLNGNNIAIRNRSTFNWADQLTANQH